LLFTVIFRSRDYNKAVDGKNTETASFVVKDHAQIHQALKEVGLSPSDYIFSPPPQNSSPNATTSSHASAFSNYPLHQRQDNERPLKPQSQYLYTPGRPISYVQQPPPPPPAAQAPYNQLQNPQQLPPQSGPSNPSVLSNLFGSAPSTQNTTSQPQPQPQGGPSALSNLFGSAPNTQNTTSQPQPQPQGGPSALSNLFGSAPNTQNTTSQPPPNMSQHISSPYRSPPPPPPHISSDPHDSSFSAQHYLHQINSQDTPPVRVVKPSTQNVVYRKEIRIRYLQPPTPPPPAPIIIREKHIPPNPPESVYINLFSSSRIYQFVSFLCIATSHS